MQVHRSAVEIVIQAPAKLNLLFEVLARRDDGYHEIETLMCPIDLYDTLAFKEEPNGRLELECLGDSGLEALTAIGLDNLPRGSDNLAYRAVDMLRRHAGVARGASLRLVKRIPAAAGLGGGSSDAAAALVAANALWHLGLSTAELTPLAAQLGSDVPFFLVGGAAICRGRGERVEPVGLGAELHLVVVRPPEGLSTAAVYGQCRPAAKPHEAARLVEALRSGDLSDAGRRLHNALQPAARRLSPWIARLSEAFAAEDFEGHAMSGSGSSYFGLCRDAAHARRAAAKLRTRGLGAVYAVRTCE